MKEPRSTSFSPEHRGCFSISGLSFGDNGPYDLSCSGEEIVAISGISGIGKTLFLRALADLDDHLGQVSLNGQNCTDFSAPAWRKNVALIPAESRWWHNDVRSHMGTDVHVDELVALLESLGLCR